jgi:hypothetical protein
MGKMLVLLNRVDDIDGHLLELREIAITHRIAKVYLARVSLTFGSMVRRIVAPHKLDMAARMGDAAASKYFVKIANDLRTDRIDVEPISTGIPDGEIEEFIEKNEIDLVVTSDGCLGLCSWTGAGLVGRYVLIVCEHVFGSMQPMRQNQFQATTGRKHKSG